MDLVQVPVDMEEDHLLLHQLDMVVQVVIHTVHLVHLDQAATEGGLQVDLVMEDLLVQVVVPVDMEEDQVDHLVIMVVHLDHQAMEANNLAVTEVVQVDHLVMGVNNLVVVHMAQVEVPEAMVVIQVVTRQLYPLLLYKRKTADPHMAETVVDMVEAQVDQVMAEVAVLLLVMAEVVVVVLVRDMEKVNHQVVINPKFEINKYLHICSFI